MKTFRHILLALALLVQMLSPAMAAAQNEAGLGGYLCNMQTQAVTAEAEAQLRELFKLAGKDWPEDETPMEHCSDCVMPITALPTLTAAHSLIAAKPSQAQSFTAYALGYSYDATGPPLGSRAPPLYL